MMPAELRHRLEGLDPAGTVTVGWLLEQLSSNGSGDSDEPTRAVAGDLTCREAGLVLGRAASTIRSWLEAGELEGYRQRGREWRVTPAALQRFQEQQRSGVAQKGRRATSRHREKSTDLGAWRRQVAS
jgi:excisionase family DNA binding protein